MCRAAREGFLFCEVVAQSAQRPLKDSHSSLRACEPDASRGAWRVPQRSQLPPEYSSARMPPLLRIDMPALGAASQVSIDPTELYYQMELSAAKSKPID